MLASSGKKYQNFQKVALKMTSAVEVNNDEILRNFIFMVY